MPTDIKLLYCLRKPAIVALNLIPPLLLLLVGWLATRRAWAGCLLAALPTLALGVSNLYKVALRGDPVTVSDLRLLRTAGGIVTRYQLTRNDSVIGAVVTVIALLALSRLLLPPAPMAVRSRLIGLLACCAAVPLLLPFYVGDVSYALTENNDFVAEFADSELYASRGTWYSFLHTAPDLFSAIPSKAMRRSAERTLSRYEDADIPEEQKVQVVGVMLEAFCDLTDYPVLAANETVAALYEPLHELEQRCVSGRIITNIFAGGTVESEWNFLTGYSHHGEFTVPVDTYVRYFKAQGYDAVFQHPGYSWFYDRRVINENLGFDRSVFTEDGFGELVDPFNGLADLEDGIIATPLDPEVTFSDDPLRMMRCIRFATQLNFQIEDETFEALERMADRIKIVSGERIKDELNKIIMAPHPSIGFDYLQRSGLLQLILPELAALDIVEQRNGKAHKNNFYHTLEVLENVIKVTPHSQLSTLNSTLYLRWSALLHDIGKTKTKRWDPVVGWTFHNHNYIGAKMVPQIFRRLKLPMGAEMKYVQKLVDLHMRPQVIADNEVTDSAVRRLLNDAGDDIDDLMTLCEADITSKNEVRKKMFLENFRLVRVKLADLKEKDYKRLLQPVIDGNEIMEMFHLKPSREVGTLKQTLKDAVLDNRVENERGPLMQLLMQKAREMGLSIDGSLSK